jgi:hypothetical protein
LIHIKTVSGSGIHAAPRCFGNAVALKYTQDLWFGKR